MGNVLLPNLNSNFGSYHNQPRYRFGYNGQEKVNEWSGMGNYLDFGARGLNARVGRFSYATDPLFKKFPWKSPYIFAGNNPISFTDKKGEYQYPKGKGNEYKAIKARCIIKSCST